MNGQDTRYVVSFDYETDLKLKGDLIAQAEQADSPFSVTDFSLRPAASRSHVVEQGSERY